MDSLHLRFSGLLNKKGNAKSQLTPEARGELIGQTHLNLAGNSRQQEGLPWLAFSEGAGAFMPLKPCLKQKGFSPGSPFASQGNTRA
jgi:hypothetical protein